MTDSNASQFIIYQTEDGQTKLDVRFVDETVWLSQQQMAELFQSSRTNIVEHIGNVYAEGELFESATCREFRQVRIEGSRQVTRALPFYNLDRVLYLTYPDQAIYYTLCSKLSWSNDEWWVHSTRESRNAA